MSYKWVTNDGIVWFKDSGKRQVYRDWNLIPNFHPPCFQIDQKKDKDIIFTLLEENESPVDEMFDIFYSAFLI